MDKDKIVHAANLLVSAGALAVADSFTGGAATAIGAYFSLREVTKRQSPELQTLGRQQVAQLQAMCKGTTADDPRYHLPDMILLADLCAADLIATRLDATQTVQVMLDRIAKAAPGTEYATHAYQTCFRQHIEPMLTGIMASPGFATTLMPDFMRAILSAQDRLQHTQDQMLTLVQGLVEREADTAKALGVRETQLIALAQRVAQDVTDADRAYAELQVTVEETAKMRALGNTPSNLGQFVDQVMSRVLERAEAGDLDGAEAEALAAYEEHAAQTERMAGIVLIQARQTRNVDLTARLERERWMREGGGFESINFIREEWYVRGRDKGLRFDLEVALELAKICENEATTRTERGRALNDLGVALSILGRMDRSSGRLEEAVGIFSEALTEFGRDHQLLEWARTMNNLASSLQVLGDREGDLVRLNEAVNKHREALEVTAKYPPSSLWTNGLIGLGNALLTIAQLTGDAKLLVEVIDAYRLALSVLTRELAPKDWANTQNSLGSALRTLGQLESDPVRLTEAINAYRSALLEWTRESVPLDWARTQHNLGNVCLALHSVTGSANWLEDADAAFRLSLEVRSFEHVPLDWAATTSALGYIEALLGRRTSKVSQVETGIARIVRAISVLDGEGHTGWAQNARSFLVHAMSIREDLVALTSRE